MDRRMRRLSRRGFVVGTGAAGLGLLAGCGRLPGQGQVAPKVPRLGLLVETTPDSHPAVAPFRQALRELGYVEDRTIIFEYRWAGGVAERLPALAVELVQAQVDIIVAGSAPATRAAQAATGSIPIVFINVTDPVGTELVASLARPGGNVTGLSSEVGTGLPGKRLELLAAVVPGLMRVAVLWNPAEPGSREEIEAILEAARVLGLELQVEPVHGPDGFDSAFEAVLRQRAEAFYTVGSPLLSQHRARIAQFGLQHRLPSMLSFRPSVEAGGLMTYTASLPAMGRRAAVYVDKILKGAMPADLPVEQPMTFEFVVNMKTAQTLGITFPNEIMLQVTEVLE